MNTPAATMHWMYLYATTVNVAVAARNVLAPAHAPIATPTLLWAGHVLAIVITVCVLSYWHEIARQLGECPRCQHNMWHPHAWNRRAAAWLITTGTRPLLSVMVALLLVLTIIGAVRLWLLQLVLTVYLPVACVGDHPVRHTRPTDTTHH